jgi:hypothetical protein
MQKLFGMADAVPEGSSLAKQRSKPTSETGNSYLASSSVENARNSRVKKPMSGNKIPPWQLSFVFVL